MCISEHISIWHKKYFKNIFEVYQNPSHMYKKDDIKQYSSLCLIFFFNITTNASYFKWNWNTDVNSVSEDRKVLTTD